VTATELVRGLGRGPSGDRLKPLATSMTSALTAYEAVMAVVAKGLESTGGYLARRVKQTALKSAWEAQDLTGALARIDAALRTQQTLLQDKLAVMQAEDTEKLRPLVAAWRKVADRYEPILDKAKALTVRVSCTDTTTLLGAVQGILKEAVAALNVLGVAPASAATSSPFHVLTTVHHSITDTEAAVKALLDKLGCPSNPRTPEELQEALDREAQRKTKAQQALKDATDISDPIERELAVKVATAEVDAATQQAVKLGADLVDAKSKADVVQLAAVQSSQRALADKCTQLQGACDRARTYVQRREAGWQLQAKAVGDQAAAQRTALTAGRDARMEEARQATAKDLCEALAVAKDVTEHWMGVADRQRCEARDAIDGQGGFLVQSTLHDITMRELGALVGGYHMKFQELVGKWREWVAAVQRVLQVKTEAACGNVAAAAS
jgi:hypothetical protein